VLVVAVGLVLYWPQIPKGKALANFFSAASPAGGATDVNETKAPQSPHLLEGKQNGATEQTLTPATKEAKEGTEKNPSYPEPPQKVPAQQLSLPAAPLTAGESAGKGITMVAVRGQGITHLARFALQRYLNEQKPNVALTKEHKIFIEDFLKDNVKKTRIHPESELTFSLDLINKAITASQNLTPAKLHRLMRYSKRVPSLSAYTPLT